LSSLAARYAAGKLIDAAPHNAVVNVAAPRRTNDQNARFWALLSDVSRSKPGGRAMTPERWKAVFMQSFGHQVQFENDLDGRPFPVGHSSSRLSKQDMSDLMEFISAWGSENGVVWTEPQQPVSTQGAGRC
jgi:hypothetical protein